LAYRLRNLGWSTETESYINKSEIESLKEADHIPNQILTLQQQSLTSMVKSELIDDFYLRKIDSTLKELCDSMGKCERIKSTVFPTQYALFTLVFIVIFLILLPLGLVSHLGYLSIPVHLAIGFTFGMIQGIAESMQNPFDNKPNDIPMFSICRTVERNLLEMMGKSELPEPIQATDGVLM
ncbi:MAG: bestrophin family ion channel, partial [Bacteroidia bacterium]